MADHLLEVRDLSVDFHTAQGVVNAVQNVSWHLDCGEVLAILGESGSGKSVSASAIIDLIDCPPGQITSGEILYEGSNLLTMSRAARREINGHKIAMIFQDPLSHLNPVFTVGWQIEEALTTHGTPSKQASIEAVSLLQRVGIPMPAQSLEKYPHQFSGGQRQRVMIAMALALKPDILIADEPTTALDVTVQAQILSLLETLQEETGMGLLLITHDLGVVAEIADRVVVMNSGQIVEQGTALDVYKNPRHTYTKNLIAAAPGSGVMAETQSRHEPPLLSIKNLSKSYGRFVALDDINIDLMEGECIAIVGESGSGKSTLAKCLVQLEKPSTGSAIYNKTDLFGLSAAQLLAVRRDIQMVFQDPTQSLNPRMRVYDIISEAWLIHPNILPKEQWHDRAIQLLNQVGLSRDMLSRKL